MAGESSQIYSLLAKTDNVRVLHLQPGSGHDPIVTTLSEQSLRPGNDHDALSYVWGSATHQREILCNGVADSVTANLFAALKRLRHATDNQLLWIDASCINQADAKEKTDQVLQMRDVYATA